MTLGFLIISLSLNINTGWVAGWLVQTSMLTLLILIVTSFGKTRHNAGLNTSGYGHILVGVSENMEIFFITSLQSLILPLPLCEVSEDESYYSWYSGS